MAINYKNMGSKIGFRHVVATLALLSCVLVGSGCQKQTKTQDDTAAKGVNVGLDCQFEHRLDERLLSDGVSVRHENNVLDRAQIHIDLDVVNKKWRASKVLNNKKEMVDLWSLFSGEVWPIDEIDDNFYILMEPREVTENAEQRKYSGLRVSRRDGGVSYEVEIRPANPEADKSVIVRKVIMKGECKKGTFSPIPKPTL